MTDRFKWNSVLTNGWWKNNSKAWYLMLAMGALGGFLLYSFILHDKVSSGLQAGLVGVWLCLAFVCCWIAAHTHIAHRKAAEQTPEVNIKIPLFLTATSQTLGTLLLNRGDSTLMTAPMWMIFGMAWVLLFKNLIVFIQLEWTRD